MPHENWKPKCVERFKEYAERLDSNDGHVIANTLTVQYLHRLIPEEHIDPSSRKPKFSRLTDADLSVLLEGPDLPDLDVEKAVLDSAGRFVGAWKFPVDLYPTSEPHFFEVHHDPLPDNGREQHKNHGMVFCNKGMERCREVVKCGDWSCTPSDEIFQAVLKKEQQRKENDQHQ